MQIHCTKRLSNLLGLTPETNSAQCFESYPLGIWYANIFDVNFDPYLSHRENSQYLLMLNTESLLSLSISIPDELSCDQFVTEIPTHMNEFFTTCGFTKNEIAYLKNTQKEYYFTKATNKSMLGFLRSLADDHAKAIRDHARIDSLLDRTATIVAINKQKRDRLVAGNAISSAKQIINTTLRRKK